MFLSRNNPCREFQTLWQVCWKLRPLLFRMYRTARKGLAVMVIAMSVDPARPTENDGTVIGRTNVAAISLVVKADVRNPESVRMANIKGLGMVSVLN